MFASRSLGDDKVCDDFSTEHLLSQNDNQFVFSPFMENRVWCNVNGNFIVIY